jgi:hypothetical protein
MATETATRVQDDFSSMSSPPLREHGPQVVLAACGPTAHFSGLISPLTAPPRNEGAPSLTRRSKDLVCAAAHFFSPLLSVGFAYRATLFCSH